MKRRRVINGFAIFAVAFLGWGGWQWWTAPRIDPQLVGAWAVIRPSAIFMELHV